MRAEHPEGGQLRLLGPEKTARIHGAALAILAEAGVSSASPAVLDLYERGGARVDRARGRVFIPEALVSEALARAPKRVILAGRDPKNDLPLGGLRVYAGTGGAELNVLDLETGVMRPSRLRDVSDLARLVDALDHIDYYIRPVVAQDVPLEALDINTYYAALSSTGKHVMGNAQSAESAREVIGMAALIAGGREALAARPIISFITCWMVSPLTLEPSVTDVLLAVVSERIPVALSSVAILGLTSPVTMAANLALTHAEQLSGIVLTQLAAPGAPVIYGGCPGVCDMASLSFAPGSIERQIMNAAICELARFVRLPNYNLAGVTDAKLPDVQAGFEKAFGIAMSALSGSNYIHHAAGRVKDGVAPEQYVIDDEIIGMARRALRGIPVDDETLAVREIIEAGPGGRFVDRPHTARHVRSEFFRPRVADRRDRAAWEKDGAKDGRERARAIARKILAEHRPPPIPPDVDAIIRKRFGILPSNP